VEDELNEELRYHLERQTQQSIDQGQTPDEARLTALRMMSGIESRKEECRDHRGLRTLEFLIQDVRYSIRGLRREPALALAAILTLAICICANTTVFSIVNSILIRPLPFPDAHRIHWVDQHMIQGGQPVEIGLGPDYYSIRELNKVFEDIAAYDRVTANWTGIEKPEQLEVARVTPSYFRVMGDRPLLGRFLSDSEEGPAAPAVAVISYSFWHSRLAADPNIVGKTIQLDRIPTTVIGVTSQGFNHPRGVDVWKPIDIDDASQRPRSVKRPMRAVQMVARLKQDASPSQLSSDLERISDGIRREYPAEFLSAGFMVDLTVRSSPLQQRMTASMQPALLALSGAVTFVVLIACANLASLLLARSTARQKEMAIRLALGSDRRRIARQVLTESMAIALPGGAIGAGMAFLAIQQLNLWRLPALTSYPEISVDAATLVFTLASTVMAGLAFGTAPAIAASRTNVYGSLSGLGYTQSAGPRYLRLRRMLVVSELSMLLVLLIGAGLLARSFVKLAQTELGFNAENVLTMRVNIGIPAYAGAERKGRFYNDVLERVRSLPMIRSAAVATDLPLTQEAPYLGMRFQVVGGVPLPIFERPEVQVSIVSEDFFRTMSIPLRSGRTFDSRDDAQSAGNIVVNEAFVRRAFPSGAAEGQGIVTSGSDGPPWIIVGVVGDIRGSNLRVAAEPLIYRCTCQGLSSSRMRLIVKTAGNPRDAIRPVESQVYAVDRNQPVFDMRTMIDWVEESLSSQRFNLFLLGTFAGIATLLAGIGVFGVTSYLVTRRTHEIGIRMAMGALPSQVLRLVAVETAGLIALGIVGGLVAALGLTRYLATLLYGVSSLDMATFVVATAVLAAIALLASWIPTRRASRIDPLTALRLE